MFGGKRKKAPRHGIRLIADDGCVLYDGPLTGLAVPENVVLSLSEAFFGDPEPCHIHRSAVHSRICLELCGACEGKGPVDIAALPDAMRAYLSAFADARTIEITEM